MGNAMASDSFRSITIKGFRSIRSIENLYLRPINLLIGANGSGKSNFLEAFVFVGEAEAGRLKDYVVRLGGADRILYFGSKTTNRIDFELQAGNGLNLIAHYLYTANDELAGMATRGGWWEGQELPSPSYRRYQFRDTGDSSPLRRTNSVHDNRMLREHGSNLAAFLYRLSYQFKEQYELIRKTVQIVAPFFEDFQLAPLALNPDTIKLEWRHRNSDQYFDASSFSDGTLRFIALATLLLQPVELRPAVILVDEPELGLHPYAVELLASLIKQASKETQMIAATQSSLLLDYFEPEDVLVADRVKGATEIKRLQQEPLAEWLKEYSLGQLWEKGELSGRPGKE
jgi:predicted ATPase